MYIKSTLSYVQPVTNSWGSVVAHPHFECVTVCYRESSADVKPSTPARLISKTHLYFDDLITKRLMTVMESGILEINLDISYSSSTPVTDDMLYTHARSSHKRFVEDVMEEVENIKKTIDLGCKHVTKRRRTLKA